MARGTVRRDNAKLKDLRNLLNAWAAGLWLFLTVAVLAAVIGVIKITLTGESAPLLAAVIAGAAAVFGHLFSKFADFKKQYIEIENGVLDHESLVRKRLIAFHAEINGNLVALADYFSKARRRQLTNLVLEDPNGNRFSKADAANPIYDDNRSHLYEFKRPTIEAITNYYNLESNLNLAIDALSLGEFKVLATAQKLQWHIYTLRLVDHVVHMGDAALRAITEEIGDPDTVDDKTSRKVTVPKYPREADLVWEPVSEEELKPLLDWLEKLHPPKAPVRRSRGRKSARKAVKPKEVWDRS